MPPGQGQGYMPPQQGQGQGYAPPGYAPPGYSQQQQQQQQDPHMLPQAPIYQPVNNPNAKRKALFIGINYFRTSSELRGCIADVRNVHDWLIANYGFKEICILTDDSKDPRGQPTRQNIINGMDWLVRGAQPGDAFFFHFSGHGSRVKDTNGDEADGWDETICPVDYDRAGMIVDDVRVYA
jgi:hypothetical protein